MNFLPVNTLFEAAIALTGTIAFRRVFDRMQNISAVVNAQNIAADVARIGDQALPIIDTVWALYGPSKYPVAKILRSAVDVLGAASAIRSPQDFAGLLSYVEKQFSPSAYAEHASDTKTIAPQLFAMGKAIGEALG